MPRCFTSEDERRSSLEGELIRHHPSGLSAAQRRALRREGRAGFIGLRGSALFISGMRSTFGWKMARGFGRFGTSVAFAAEGPDQEEKGSHPRNARPCPRAPPIGCARQPHDDAISDAGSALEIFVYALQCALSSSSASREAQRFASTDIKLGSNLIDVELGRKQKC